MHRIYLLFITLFFVTWPPSSWAAITQQTPPLAETCAACHGYLGNSTVPDWPKIAGQNKRYLVKQLMDYQKGVRGRNNPIMFNVVKNLTKEEIISLANYFSQQTMSSGIAAVQYIPLGREIYKGGNREKNIPACSACHDPQGKGNFAAGFPALGGQHAAYIARTLTEYKNKTRAMDPNQIMRTIAANLTDEEITAVASYIEGLH